MVLIKRWTLSEVLLRIISPCYYYMYADYWYFPTMHVYRIVKKQNWPIAFVYFCFETDKIGYARSRSSKDTSAVHIQGLITRSTYVFPTAFGLYHSVLRWAAGLQECLPRTLSPRLCNRTSCQTTTRRAAINVNYCGPVYTQRYIIPTYVPFITADNGEDCSSLCCNVS